MENLNCSKIEKASNVSLLNKTLRSLEKSLFSTKKLSNLSIQKEFQQNQSHE
jgi:hypothetical protein